MANVHLHNITSVCLFSQMVLRFFVPPFSLFISNWIIQCIDMFTFVCVECALLHTKKEKEPFRNFLLITVICWHFIVLCWLCVWYENNNASNRNPSHFSEILTFNFQLKYSKSCRDHYNCWLNFIHIGNKIMYDGSFFLETCLECITDMGMCLRFRKVFF